MSESGIVNIRGKQYTTVAKRVQDFREAHPEWSLITDILNIDETSVVMKAAILDVEGRIIATGHAEEVRAASQINRSSAVENCETSAIGRALASLGFGGQEFASANEVQGAIQQQEDRQQEYLAKVIQSIEASDPFGVALVMAGMNQDEQQALFNGTSSLSSKQKSTVREMNQKAVVSAQEYAEAIEEGTASGDSLKVLEAWEELSENGKRYVWRKLSPEAHKAITEAKEAA